MKASEILEQFAAAARTAEGEGGDVVVLGSIFVDRHRSFRALCTVLRAVYPEEPTTDEPTTDSPFESLISGHGFSVHRRLGEKEIARLAKEKA